METKRECLNGYGDKGPFWPSSNRPCEYPVEHVQLMYKIGIVVHSLCTIISANGILVFVQAPLLTVKTWATLFSSCGYYVGLCLCGLIIGPCYIFFAGAYLKDEQYSIMIDETCSIVSAMYWFGGTLALFIILRRWLQRAHVGSVGRETENLKHYFDQLSLIPKISLFISFGFAVVSCIDQKLLIICFLSGFSGNINLGVKLFVFDFVCLRQCFFIQYFII